MQTTAEGETARPGGLGLQVVALILATLVPVAWLIGRRTVPPPLPVPLVLNPAEPIVALRLSAEGLMAGPTPTHLAAPADAGGAYRLELLPGGGDPGARPPYRLKLMGPGGNEVWQGSWAGTKEERLQVVLPAGGLQSGPHTIVSVDTTGRLRSFPFLVP
ncbi:MAG: hypothetical protein AUH92_00685 [Acidobacteria bacterium 13_1_40CM_4_69_4]|nr:MAG: hypothetical protein AUH92_00685 [Acidobacteria bacterium 13_1_40CM_4_69_4]